MKAVTGRVGKRFTELGRGTGERTSCEGRREGMSEGGDRVQKALMDGVVALEYLASLKDFMERHGGHTFWFHENSVICLSCRDIRWRFPS